MGYDPTNINAVEEVNKSKNADIATLRKQLEISYTKYPQTKEISQLEQEKQNMFKIIMEHNVLIEKNGN